MRERVRAEIQKVFKEGASVERVYFPAKSADVPNRAALTLVVLDPELPAGDPATRQMVDQMTREHGSSGRTFKSALIWLAAESAAGLMDDARKLLAWEEIQDEQEELHLDAAQQKQLAEARGRAARDLRESVWRAYNKILLLGRGNDWKEINLGLVHSSAADTMVGLILARLRQDDEVTEGVSPYTLLRNWPAMTAWSTAAVRDAFYASPQLPRLLNADALRRTMAEGVAQKLLAYVGPVGEGGKYYPFVYGETLLPGQVEFSESMFLITADEAKRQIEEPKLARLEVRPNHVQIKPGESCSFTANGFDQHDRPFMPGQVAWEATGCTIDVSGRVTAGESAGYYTVTARVEALSATAEVVVATEGQVLPDVPPVSQSLSWQGSVPQQKWMNFYTRVLTRFVAPAGLKLQVRFHVAEGVTPQQVEETRAALRELGLDERALRVGEEE